MSGTPQGWIVFGGVLAVLVIASTIGYVLSRRANSEQSQKVIGNLNARIKAWWIMIFVLAGALAGGPKVVIVLFAQHLQPSLGYTIFRYFENIAPGRSGGGWVDPGGMTAADRYAEQLWITLFAKSPEQTLFDFR